jgi:hypothetical protein
MLAIVDLFLVAVCVMAGRAGERRSHFWTRVLLGCLSVPSLVLVVVAVAHRGQPAPELALLIVVAAFALVPALCCQSPDSLPGPSDEDDRRGSGPDRPSPSPQPPYGGAPLPDAEPSRVRLRDHGPPKSRYVKRWRLREPEREPAPAPPNQ